jgi:hypothetical protein
MVVHGPHALDDRVQSDLGRVIARWRFEEAERRAAIDLLEPPSGPGGARIAFIPLDVIGAALVALGSLSTWFGGSESGTVEIGFAALLAGGLLLLVRLLAVISGRVIRRRLLQGPPEVIIGERGVSVFGRSTRWGTGLFGRRLEGASLISIAGAPFLNFAYSIVSGRGSTQGQRVGANLLVPVPTHQIPDAEAMARRFQEQTTS